MRVIFNILFLPAIIIKGMLEFLADRICDRVVLIDELEKGGFRLEIYSWTTLVLFTKDERHSYLIPKQFRNILNVPELFLSIYKYESTKKKIVFPLTSSGIVLSEVFDFVERNYLNEDGKDKDIKLYVIPIAGEFTLNEDVTFGCYCLSCRKRWREYSYKSKEEEVYFHSGKACPYCKKGLIKRIPDRCEIC